MKWIELTVLTTSVGSELVADIMSELGSDGVSIFDSSDLAELIKSDVIWDYIDEHLLIKSDVVKVKGYYDLVRKTEVEAELTDRLEYLRSHSDCELGSLECLSCEIEDEDWVNIWKKNYKPINIGKIAIVPIWLTYDAKDGEVIVYMDPGRAFGTGEHESTKLCLGMLNRIDVKGKTVLDIGCGSGILGIAASKCGAKKVILSDIDSIAVSAALENANLNNAKNVTVENSNLLANANVKGQLIFANITADILIALSKDIDKALEPGGNIILSGIIKKRYDEVLKAYLDRGYQLIDNPIMGEWRGILLKKN